MHQFHIPQYTIQNRNVHISVLNGVLWDMRQLHCGICEFGLLDSPYAYVVNCWCLCVHNNVTERQLHVMTSQSQEGLSFNMHLNNTTFYSEMVMSSWWPLHGLLFWYPTMLSSHCNKIWSAPVDEIYGCRWNRRVCVLQIGCSDLT